jgi:transcriptional regulator with XRE-family HTH domain
MNIKIKDLRLKAKLTQLELSQLVGVSRSSIAQYELGTIQPRTKVLVKLAKIFNVDLNEMKRDSASQVAEELAPYLRGLSEESGKQIISLLQQIDRHHQGISKAHAEIWRLLRQRVGRRASNGLASSELGTPDFG